MVTSLTNDSQRDKMDREILEKYITSLLPMPTDKAKLFAEQFEPVDLQKSDLILKENKISMETYFLESGFIRSFTLDNNGEEITTNIFSAPCFVNDFLSFFKQQPAKENLQTLTNCRLWKMSYDVVQTNFHTYPEFREFGRIMLVTNYSILHDRMLEMIKDTAEDRYLKMLRKHAAIFQNIPLKIIASYLGITDTSLSRIRKEIAQK